MRKQKLYILLLLLPTLVFAKKLADLPEVMRAPTIHIAGERIFLCEEKTIHIYSLKDFRHIKQFCKEGDGPGEYKLYINLEVFPDILVVTSMGKMSTFTHDGELIKDYKIHPGILTMLQVGSNFVGSLFDKTGQKINLYDKNVELIKNIYEGGRGKTSYFESGKKNDLIMVKDYVSPYVYNDKIFIFDTTKGFFVSVLDDKGGKIYEINGDYKRMPVDEEYKNKKMQIEKEDPNWEYYQKRYNYIFPEYFPAFRTAFLTDDKIYFITYKIVDKKHEIIVTDLRGNILRKTFIPPVPNDLLLYTINKERFYYLIENEDEEMWELHVEDIK